MTGLLGFVGAWRWRLVVASADGGLPDRGSPTGAVGMQRSIGSGGYRPADAAGTRGISGIAKRLATSLREEAGSL